jgi:hypothetical protein
VFSEVNRAAATPPGKNGGVDFFGATKFATLIADASHAIAPRAPIVRMLSKISGRVGA